ncbi:fungal-specific transcription factor domain-containing protein [Paraphoma chrysanthemicola]|nr:fungal-specific transcription factor domain-containing protein [Paraphoma chrysanthemicola]
MPGEACRPCRERKLKCDAATTGIPCARCKSTSRVDDCVVPPRQKRTINRHKRIRLNSVSSNSRRDEQSQQPSTSVNRFHGEPQSTSQPETFSTVSQLIDHPSTPPPEDTRVPTITHARTPSNGGTGAVPTSHDVDQAAFVTGTPVSEDTRDDVLARVCQEMTSIGTRAQRTNMSASWSKSLEYHSSLNATGILGEVFGGRECNKFTIIDRGALHARRDDELRGLDQHDLEYLQAKGVFNLPPREVCLEMFKVYFRHAYPYAPIIDRGEFLAQFSREEHSTFLVQTLLANVTPYTSKDLLARAGFADHSTAQDTFFRRAVLLYDFNCEKSQLVLLQGSLLLGTLWRSYFGDKDYSYWMCNAVRIATRMGLHKKHIANELGARFYALLKRIWWTLYVRDVISSISGLYNSLLLRADDIDTLALTADDWPSDDEVCPAELIDVLPPIRMYHKDYMIQLCNLAAIGKSAHSTVLSCAVNKIDRTQALDLLESIFEWRLALPRSLRMESIRQWEDEGIWVLTLMAWCYRLECVTCRSLRKACVAEPSELERFTDLLHKAVFELDAIVRRAVTHRVGQLLPMSFSTAVATMISLCIELLLKPDLRPSDKLVSEEAVRTGIAFLVGSQESWPSLRWMLRMFDWAFAQAGLDFSSGLPRDGTPTQDQGLAQFLENMSSQNLFVEQGPLDFMGGSLLGGEFMFNSNGFANW